MFKKIILPTILAGGLLGINHAHADEVDFEELSQKAKANSYDINHSPIHKGAYDYNFTREGVNYHFYSDGTHFGYEWHDTKLENPTQDHLTSNPNVSTTPSEKIDKQQQLFDTNKEQAKQTESTPNYTYEQQKQNENYVLKRFNENKQSQNIKPQPVSAPVKNDGSVKSQFLANGGNEALWQAIVLPESGGNPNAVSPNGYQGLGQTKESWGTGSVATQTQGMLNYAKSRYGSVSNAISFRQANGWW